MAFLLEATRPNKQVRSTRVVTCYIPDQCRRCILKRALNLVVFVVAQRRKLLLFDKPFRQRHLIQLNAEKATTVTLSSPTCGDSFAAACAPSFSAAHLN